MGQREQEIELVLLEALEKRTPGERAAYLERVCGDDPRMRVELDSLLKFHARAGDFLETPPVAVTFTEDEGLLSEDPGTIIDRYRLRERIGEGGMAVVYMAEQAEPIHRRVALKIIKLGMDTRHVIARFEAERQALAMMDHPNIARVFDAGATETGRPYFVMELVQGVSITEYCDRNNLSTKDRLGLFIQVCDAVQHAHQKGIIHRDIKPSNVMVTHHDGKPTPKVIDFGIAKATKQKLTEKTLFTRYAHVIGTPAYMSPEQAQLSDLDVDTRTDIYSLGVLLYELLTGTTPFSEKELRKAGYLEMQRVIREEEPLRPSTRITTLGEAAQEVATRRGTSVTELTKRLRSELEWIPLMAMRKDRTQRYASASELAHDVQNYLNDKPLVAGPESVMYRLRKTVRKHRVPLIAGSAAVVALLVGLIVSTSLYVNLRRAQTTATKLTTQAEVYDKLATVERLYGLGRYEEALDEIDATLHEYDAHSQAHLLRAQLLLELARMQEADEELDELTRAEPEIAGAAHYLLARANVAVDPAKADRHRELAESTLPGTAEAYYFRAMTAASAEEAITWLSKTLELDPQHHAARKARTLAGNSVKAYQGMLEDAGAMVVLRPHDYLGYSLRAMARRELGQLEEAVGDSARAIAFCSIEDELPRLYEQRIRTYMRMGEYQKALADAQQHIALSPDSSDGYFHAFVAHLALGDYAKACTVYQEFTRGIIGPDKRPIGLFEGRLEGYVFDLLEGGQSFALPLGVAEQAPFYLMQQSAELHALLKTMAKPLAVCDGFWPGGGWSPDGRCLVYQRHSSFSWLPDAIASGDPAMNEPRIEIMELETGRTRQTSGSGYNPAWSPDGQFIAYTKYFGTDAQKGIWVMSTAGGRPRRLSAGEGGQWDRDSKHIYFGKEGTLYSIAIDVPNAEPVPMAEVPPGLLSPQGDWIVTLEKVRDCVSGLRVLTFPEGRDVARWRLPWPFRRWCTPLQWHPNGKTLILSSRYYDSQMGVCLFDIETGKATHVLNLTRPWCQTMWSPDGSRLLISPFVTAAGTPPWIMKIDPERPVEEVLAPALSTEDFLRMLRKRWDQRIAADPVYAKHYVDRAVVRLASGDYEGAEQDVKHCAQLIDDPNDPALHALRYWGEMYANTDRHQEVETLGRVNLALADRYPEQYPAATDAKHPGHLLMQAYRLQEKTDRIADLKRKRPDLFPASSGGLRGSQDADVSPSHDP